MNDDHSLADRLRLLVERQATTMLQRERAKLMTDPGATVDEDGIIRMIPAKSVEGKWSGEGDDDER